MHTGSKALFKQADTRATAAARRLSHRRTGAIAGAALLASGGAGAQAGEPALRLTVEPQESVLFSHGRDACEPWDIPDTPTRAFRDAAGTIHVFQSHHRARALTGRSFGALAHSCRVAYQAAGLDDPASFSNRSWIAATYTHDGRTVHAVLHDEYRGHLAGRCDTSEADACWYNTLTAAVSHDGGARFEPAEPRLVAALPQRADETRGRRAGFFEPTNIVPVTGGFAMMANVVAPEPQRSGNCLLRTDDLADASRWRAWHDGAYRTRIADPYREDADPAAHLCDPIDPTHLPWPVTSLVRHERSGQWIATMKGRRADAHGRERTGVFVSTSVDLLHWQGPTLVLEAPLMGSGQPCAPDQPIGYPALIDPESADRNFATVGDRPMLTFVRSRLEGCRIGTDRDVAMRPVRIEPAD
ncbi:hypothetical protein [Aureimonas jatrophae]|uniref:Uncharacterized protein n=1 Tax=Aureimonas jatrophae TaxID=1166073 RepID=A0A1H0F3F8_9HYPH|nr:hypothetical protein [Aureimonas jatrophae]MBB3950199.1 hypothetical protein [Aureimonas jatrophae]SDN89121.1 hypothetical protein SAMN05192530_102337 [Aureimonas jatrophae]